jgi:exonuclease VII large subunit
MHDRSLAKLSLVMGAIGLAGLFLVNLLLVPTALAVGDITESRAGQIVAIEGIVKQAYTNDGHVFLVLNDGGDEIRAVVWQSTARGTGAYNLAAGDAVRITGQVTSYRGELEIVVSGVETLG